MDLFSLSVQQQKENNAPLAWRMRPQTLAEVWGQEHITGKDTPLRRSIEKDQLHSFVLYGPPGTGKTSIARIIAGESKAQFEYVKAVTAGVSEIRKIAADAADRLNFYQQRTILFVDEIHRFNKGQQDVLLPFVEDGTLILIGATTENPLYELNNALLSRMKLYVMEPLNMQSLQTIIQHALNNKERGLGNQVIDINQESIDVIVQAAQGDARMALNIVDTLVNSYGEKEGLKITTDLVQKVTGKLLLKYDRAGDSHYDTISAFIKSIRGSDPNAALYWLAVMLEAGEDPKFIARRLIVHAAEDVGLADPFALIMANGAADALNYVGLPEARIPLAEATIYLCTAPKSNSSEAAIDRALSVVRKQNKITVPPHIADAHHAKAEALLGKGQNYKYPHDFGGYVEQKYLPDHLQGLQVYTPGKNGYETKIQSFMDKLPRRK
ncbi:MAG: replication-associated recombination protein A [Bacillota bacterium]|nr:replication-associated recombination protein A [Bacillota bacterium]